MVHKNLSEKHLYVHLKFPKPSLLLPVNIPEINPTRLLKQQILAKINLSITDLVRIALLC